MLKDLISMCELLAICCEKLKISVEYEAPLARIIMVCRYVYCSVLMNYTYNLLLAHASITATTVTVGYHF